METLRELNQKDQITVIVSLHQINFASQFCPRIVALKSGEIVFDGAAADLSNDQLRWIYDSEDNLGSMLVPNKISNKSKKFE